MSSVRLIWATPNADELLAYIARVSNPGGQDKPIGKLLNYMMTEGHASPFAMVNMCLEFNCPRDIARQALRHYSISPQEFSQRYQTVEELGSFHVREFRAQHPTNRQLSVEVPADDPRHAEWRARQQRLLDLVHENYVWCLSAGGAKEVARVILPEGLTPSRLYFNGSMRSWIFYLKARLHPGTQKEHRELAAHVLAEFRKVAPVTAEVFFPTSTSDES